MKTILLITAAAALTSIAGCGFAVRSPDMYRDDTAKVLATKNGDIRACYDGILKGTPGVGGRVTVKFDVETDKGMFVNVAVDPANTTAPPNVADCVTKNIAGLGINPPDGHLGQATFAYEFNQPKS